MVTSLFLLLVRLQHIWELCSHKCSLVIRHFVKDLCTVTYPTLLWGTIVMKSSCRAWEAEFLQSPSRCLFSRFTKADMYLSSLTSQHGYIWTQKLQIPDAWSHFNSPKRIELTRTEFILAKKTYMNQTIQRIAWGEKVLPPFWLFIVDVSVLFWGLKSPDMNLIQKKKSKKNVSRQDYPTIILHVGPFAPTASAK